MATTERASKMKAKHFKAIDFKVILSGELRVYKIRGRLVSLSLIGAFLCEDRHGATLLGQILSATFKLLNNEVYFSQTGAFGS